MTHRIVVQFPADRDNAFYFRVFIRADDTLYPEIVRPGLGTIVDLDRVREFVRIELKCTRRELRGLMQFIGKSLSDHFPHGEGVITQT